MRYFKYLALLAVLALPTVYSQAQVAIGVQIGPNYGLYNPPPVCEYGYYPSYPYECAPYGYWGPEWFVDGIFIGCGPWYHFYYTHPVYYRRFYVGRGFEHIRGEHEFREREFHRGHEFREREFHRDHEFRGEEHRFGGEHGFRGGEYFRDNGRRFEGGDRGFRGGDHGSGGGRGGKYYGGGSEFHGRGGFRASEGFHGEGRAEVHNRGGNGDHGGRR
jgi:hypothetical protein